MNSKTFIASVALMAMTLGPAFAAAQEVTPIDTQTVLQTSVDPAVDMANELADLKARETDPATGFVARFFLRIKIKELENKLNIATAFK
jgi:Skp family chaperone for outer membrane proteins